MPLESWEKVPLKAHSGWIPDLNQIPRFQQVPHKKDHYPGNLKQSRQYGLASVYVHVAVLRFILQRVDVLWYMSYWGMSRPVIINT